MSERLLRLVWHNEMVSAPLPTQENKETSVMGYIRSNADYYASQGDFRSHSQRAKDIRRDIDRDKHMPDCVRDELRSEAQQNDRDSRRD